MTRPMPGPPECYDIDWNPTWGMVRDVETGAELHRLTREAEGLRSLLGVTA